MDKDHARSLLHNRFFRLVLLSELSVLFILLLIAGIRRVNASLLTPPLEFWQSRLISFSDGGWHMTGQFYRDSGFPVDEDTEIIYGPFIDLPKGDYTLKIDYQCDADQSFHVYAYEQTEKIEPQDEEILLKTRRSGTYHYIINDDVTGLETRICFNGQGDIHIYGISLINGSWNEWRNFISLLIWFLALDVLLSVYFLTSDQKYGCIVPALLTALAFSVKPGYTDETLPLSQVTALFRNDRLLMPVLFVLFFFFYRAVYGRCLKGFSDIRKKMCTGIPSLILTLCTLFGYSFQETDSWDLVFGHHLQVVKSAMAFTGLLIFFYYVINALFFIAEHQLGKTEDHRISCGILNRYLSALRSHPYIVTFATLLIVNLPYIIFSYPAIFTGDSADMILQAFNIPGGSDESVNLLSPYVMLNQRHPVAYTLLIHGLLLFGMNLFHSADFGLFLVSVIQTVSMFLAVSYLIKTLAKESASDILLLSTQLFFVLSPRFQSYLFVITKDVLYVPFYMINIILFWKLLTGRQRTKATVPLYIATLVILLVLRNESAYFTVVQMIIYVFADRKNRPVWIRGAVIVIAIHLCLTRIIYPVNMISPTTYNEPLSIAIQQTARYMRDYPNDVSPEEYAAIDTIWDAAVLGEEYDPVRSDAVKGTFKIKSPASDLFVYLKAWRSMFFKHPGVYIQSMINNYYEYYFPGKALSKNYSYERRLGGGFVYVNARCDEHGVSGMNLYRPLVFREARYAYEKARESVFSLPVLSLFLSIGSYTWLLILALFFYIYKKDRRSLLLTVPLLVIMFICLAGPCNGTYTRYFFPIMICLPAVLSLSWINMKALR
ncbi:MAG: hypothetical protein J5829_00405 [Lachnospiraceae bacterium]|nr:hypothetical protein [Lachnospiraceae bacterium]